MKLSNLDKVNDLREHLEILRASVEPFANGLIEIEARFNGDSVSLPISANEIRETIVERLEDHARYTLNELNGFGVEEDE